MPTDDSYWNWLREDAEAFRTHQWDLRPFRSGPALFTRDGQFARAYHGELYNPAEWEVRDGAGITIIAASATSASATQATST